MTIKSLKHGSIGDKLYLRDSAQFYDEIVMVIMGLILTMFAYGPAFNGSASPQMSIYTLVFLIGIFACIGGIVCIITALTTQTKRYCRKKEHMPPYSELLQQRNLHPVCLHRSVSPTGNCC